MSDKLRVMDGQAVDIGSVIEALEATPDHGEIVQALDDLRRDRVKSALGETVKAAQFDQEHTVESFIADAPRSPATIATYRRELARLFGWLRRQSIHVLSLNRENVNRYRDWLAGKYSANSVRTALSAASSFYGYLEAEGILQSSPFARIAYPRRKYAKALRPDSTTTPVMGSAEFRAIDAELRRRADRSGNRAADHNARESARRLLLAVHFMGGYGLRVSSLLSLELHGDYFTYRVKGGSVSRRELQPYTTALLERLGLEPAGSPFAGVGKSTIQNALHRLTRELADQGQIRHAYSAHDFRHCFAVERYRITKDIYNVQRALDHATPNTTATYLAGLGSL